MNHSPLHRFRVSLGLVYIYIYIVYYTYILCANGTLNAVLGRPCSSLLNKVFITSKMSTFVGIFTYSRLFICDN